MTEFAVEQRPPTVAEFARIVRAVGWHELAAHDEPVLEQALANSLFAVCAVHSGECVGCARVVGDGGLHFSIEEVAVLPAWQGRGAGRRLMEALTAWLARATPPGAAVELLTGADRAPFYERFGFRWQGAGIMRWGDPRVEDAARAVSPTCTEGASDAAPGPDAVVTLDERPPTADELRALHRAVGWVGELPADDGVLAGALARSLFAVCAVVDGRAVGCARLVGDGGVYVYLQDVVVLPAYQHRGIGERLMRSVLTWLDANCPANALVGLFAAEGKAGFYERYGFRTRPVAEPAMWLRWSR